MKVLLSAYACEPNKGSEPGVGWNFANELAKYHEVWVLTRENNKNIIEKYLEENHNLKNDNIHFIYIGLSKFLTKLKKGRRFLRIYYMIWQRKALKVAKNLNNNIHFDLVHHVTFVSYTQPCYMYKLGIPFIWGTIGGGENIPKGVKIDMTIKEKIYEKIRIISQKMVLLSISNIKCMKHAKKILVTTEETKNKIPIKYHNKVEIIPAIAIENKNTIKDYKPTDKIKIIMAGRLIYLKAYDIGIKSFIRLVKKYSNIELHILGDGERKKLLEQLCGEYLNKNVFFEKSVRHDDIYDFYKKFDIYLNTSLRDSGCMTMMEAMSVGLPTIAIATGGPKVLIKDFRECQIEPISYQYCVDDIIKKLEKLIVDKNYREQLGKQQYKYANNHFTIQNKIKEVLKFYERKNINYNNII